ncbi:MAG: SUMF1/EgtB/PvdO family nonheme iron enzyme [Chloroflexota bacterium]
MKYILLLLLPMMVQLQTSTPVPDTAGHQAGDVVVDSSGIEQVWVPAGCFLMGTSDEQAQTVKDAKPPTWVVRELFSEQPQHQACLTQDYRIDRTEVTNAAFQAFVDDGGYTNISYWSEDGAAWLETQAVNKLPQQCMPELIPDAPRVCVTWYEAEAYAAWRGGSLPTEAQWEYAARGPDSLIYPWGNTWDEQLANVVDSTNLTPVGTYPDGVSWVGALDMSGNAMEWVQDWLSTKYYQSSATDDPLGPEKGTHKVEKGGWWGSNPFVARGAYRHYEDPPTYQDHHIGFRIISIADE